MPANDHHDRENANNVGGAKAITEQKKYARANRRRVGVAIALANENSGFA